MTYTVRFLNAWLSFSSAFNVPDKQVYTEPHLALKKTLRLTLSGGRPYGLCYITNTFQISWCLRLIWSRTGLQALHICRHTVWLLTEHPSRVRPINNKHKHVLMHPRASDYIHSCAFSNNALQFIRWHVNQVTHRTIETNIRTPL